MNEVKRIRRAERDAILQALRMGQVPRLGLQYIQVGRKHEVIALGEDVERVMEGGSSIRFVIGEYGSGKTFVLHLVAAIAQERRLVTSRADLAPNRRLFGTGGQARNLYAELMQNMATRSKPEGGALQSVVEKFSMNAMKRAKQTGQPVGGVIQEQLRELQDSTRGYDFVTVLEHYCAAHEIGDDALQGEAIRWLRGEYSTKTEARQALGVRTIIDDSSVYDHLKLMAKFVKLAGYTGLFIQLDEMVNLYKLPSGVARRSNYEQLLHILNDTLGAGYGLGFVLSGTPEFLADERKGLFSYEALRSRLSDNSFAREDIVDFHGPVIRLENLSPTDLLLLFKNIRQVFQANREGRELISDEGIRAFMAHCSNQIGERYFQTPRMSVKAFTEFLSVLEQNPQASWGDLIGDVTVDRDSDPELDQLDMGESSDSDELVDFRL